MDIIGNEVPEKDKPRRDVHTHQNNGKKIEIVWTYPPNAGGEIDRVYEMKMQGRNKKGRRRNMECWVISWKGTREEKNVK